MNAIAIYMTPDGPVEVGPQSNFCILVKSRQAASRLAEVGALHDRSIQFDLMRIIHGRWIAK